ncbi:MAG: polyphosphate polymerase domain-containing protein, partial [Candidatus Aminicenantes bacterium]|nr:polyphosphate polymerase domain-containing protein [Candidatus Aminicenantes bacterium]
PYPINRKTYKIRQMSEKKPTQPGSRQLKTYRHELKYFLSKKEYTIFSKVFRKTIRMDPNCKENFQYWIRSLYFDTLDNNDFYDKIIGVNRRKKIRLRLYDLDQQQVKIEIKNRYNEYMMKETAFLEKKEVHQLIKGDRDFLLKKNNPTLNRIYYYLTRDFYRPTVLIDYEREAYLSEIQNIRITFDKNIRASTIDFNIFNKNAHLIPIFDHEIIVLEVKFHQFLPQYIKKIISNCQGSRQAISKYCISRIQY